METGANQTADAAGSAPSEDLVARLASTLDDDPELIPDGSRVLVGVSGGGDSLALLYLLLDLAEERGFDLLGAHFDHAVRPESRDVARRVGARFASLGLTLHEGRASSRLSGQEAYREARLEFLNEVADRVGADRIALAHQADDQVETVLMRLLRGTGLRGLAGMPRRRGRIVRPLLAFGRSELRAELERRDVGWHSDPSNLDPAYRRTTVRTGLLPLLREEGPVEELLTEIAADSVVADRDADRRAVAANPAIADLVARIELEPGGGAQIARVDVADYDRADLARLLRILARFMGIRLTRGGTGAGVSFITRGSSGGHVDLGGGLRLVREFEVYRMFRASEVAPDREVVIEAAAPGRATARLDGRVYEVVWGERSDAGEMTIVLDPADLVFPLTVRGPRPGDRIRTHVGSRKLKKLFNEQRVPATTRAQVPVLAASDGRVVWVAGHAVGQEGMSGGEWTAESRGTGFAVRLEGKGVGER